MIFNEENKIIILGLDFIHRELIGLWEVWGEELKMKGSCWRQQKKNVISEVEQVMMFGWKIINTDILFFRITCTNESFTIRPIYKKKT